ncbi:MAG: phosphorylase [Moorea sp. SIO2B7]|nr:phosphorylase [Moorena sp. SIO2B7]
MSEEQPSSQKKLPLKPGTLWTSITKQTEYAISSGALQSIATEYEFVEQDGIRFLVRILSNLDRKEKAKQEQYKKSVTSGKEFNPFLPYEEDLFVTDISDTHLCLLNKFNVVPHHLLIITRAFEEQENWITLADFEAMWACLREIDGLVFYNAGKIAGASQRHKHLQLVPFPFTPEGNNLPIETAIASAQFQSDIGIIPSFPFRHAIAKLDSSGAKYPLEAAKTTLDSYFNLLTQVGLQVEGNSQSGAYNLLATREWMLIVPRSQDSFSSIAVNSLGFAGALLVRNEQQMSILKEYTPMTILNNVAYDTNNNK